MKYWKTDIYSIKSWVFLALIMVTLAICLLPLHWPAALTYPGCCHL